MAARKQRRLNPLGVDLLLVAVARAGAESDRKNHFVRFLIRRPDDSGHAQLHAATAESIRKHLGSGYQDPMSGLEVSVSQVEAIARRAMAQGLLERNRYYSQWWYRLSAKGRRHLGQLKRLKRLPSLPPNPEWRQWKQARDNAVIDLPGYRHELKQQLAKLRPVVDSDYAGQFFAPNQATDRPVHYGQEIESLVGLIVAGIRALNAPEPEK